MDPYLTYPSPYPSTLEFDLKKKKKRKNNWSNGSKLTTASADASA